MQLIFAFIVAVAIPFQGVAAASMAACSHANAAAQHIGAREVGHAAVAQAGEHAAMGHHVHSSLRAEPDPNHAARAGRAGLAESKCSACAACCTGTAMPSTSVGFQSIALTDFFAPFVPMATPAFLTTGLERPPRSSPG